MKYVKCIYVNEYENVKYLSSLLTNNPVLAALLHCDENETIIICPLCITVNVSVRNHLQNENRKINKNITEIISTYNVRLVNNNNAVYDT